MHFPAATFTTCWFVSSNGPRWLPTGYARVTGKVGVCMATSGPGATNLVTGLANALLDSVPVVAITGQVVQPLIGRDAFQEVDITGITLPVTKHNYLVPADRGYRADDQGSVLSGALGPARSGAGRHPEESLHRQRRNTCRPTLRERRGYQPTTFPTCGRSDWPPNDQQGARSRLIMAGHGIMLSGS